MKIAFISTYFHPIKGGAENNCFYIAKELAKTHEVHIFTSDRKDNLVLKNEEIVDNIHIHRFKTLFRYRYYLAFYPKMLRSILKKDLDIVHVHSLGFLWHDFCILLKN